MNESGIANLEFEFFMSSLMIGILIDIVFDKKIYLSLGRSHFKNISKIVFEKMTPNSLVSNEEKFRDSNNNIIEIEAKGTRTHNGVCFKARDVENQFELPNLRNLIQKNYTYELNVDYKIFYLTCNKPLVQKYDLEEKMT
jgi:hypothetical protein